jgi:hypothetical protein
MTTQQHRRLAHFATAVALLFLFPLLFVHLVASRKHQEESEQTAILIGDRLELSARLRTAEQLLDLDAGLPGQADAASANLELVAATEFPESESAVPAFSRKHPSCAPIVFLANSPVSYRCATLVESRSGSGISGQLASPRYRLAASKLPSMFPISYSGLGLPSLMFAHLRVTTRDSSILLVYPAVHLDSDYDPKQRPFSGNNQKYERLLISPLYHDYVTRVSMLTLSREWKRAGSEIQLGVDVRVSEPSSSETAYFLNFLFSTTAFLVFWRYYFDRRRVYVFYLTLATMLLSLIYAALTVNSLVLDQRPISTDDLARFLSFLPNGSLLIVAGRGFFTDNRSHLLSLLAWCTAVEAACAAINLSMQNSLLPSLFGCVALCYFGISVFRHGHLYRSKSLAHLAPHPRYTAIYILGAYIFWGMSQFALVLSSPHFRSTWQAFARLSAPTPIREIFLEANSVFIVLMYAKGIALFLTTLYLAAVDAADDRIRLFQKNPLIELNSEGIIVSHENIESRSAVLTGRSFASILTNPDDIREVNSIILAKREDAGFNCRVGPPFGNGVFSLTFVVQPDGRRQWVFLRPVDRPSFLGRMYASLVRDLVLFVRQLETQVARQSSLEAAPGGEVLAFVRETGGALLKKAEVDGAVVVAGDQVTEPSSPTASMLECLRSVATGLDRDGVSSRVQDPDSALPRLLRVPSVIVNWLVHTVVRKIGPKITRGPLAIAVFRGEDDPAEGGEGYVSVCFSFSGDASVYAIFREDMDGDSSYIKYVVDAFRLWLHVRPDGTTTNVLLRFPCFISSAQFKGEGG